MYVFLTFYQQQQTNEKNPFKINLHMKLTNMLFFNLQRNEFNSKCKKTIYAIKLTDLLTQNILFTIELFLKFFY